MPVPRDVIGIKGDECQCGRKASRLHCLECGSTRIRTRSGPNVFHTHMDGVVRKVPKQHHCDTCGHDFIPEEREWCKAVPVGAAAAARKLQVLAEAEGNPSNTPEQNAEAKRILLEHLRRRASPAEARAIQTLEKQLEKETSAQQEDQDNVIRQQARVIYRNAAKDGTPYEETEEEFVEKSFWQWKSAQV